MASSSTPPTQPIGTMTVPQIMTMTPPLQPGEAQWPLPVILRYRNWYLQLYHPGHPLITLTVNEIMNMTPPLRPGEDQWTEYDLARYRNWYLQRDQPGHPLIDTGDNTISDNQVIQTRQRAVPPPLPQQPPYQSP